MALTNWYVDASGGNDANSGASHALAKKTTAAGLALCTDATNGDQLNICASATDIVLDLAPPRTPSAGAPLYVAGYTAAVNDGGMAVLSGNAAGVLLNSNAWAQTTFKNIRFTNSGANKLIVTTGAGNQFDNCEFDTSSVTRAVDVSGWFVNCRFHHFTASSGSSVGWITSTYIYCRFWANTCNASLNSNSFFSIYDVSNSTTAKPIVQQNPGIYIGNTIYGNANTIYAIDHAQTANVRGGINLNNIIVGFSGAGAAGIRSAAESGITGFNAFFNNTANYAVGEATLGLAAGDIQLSADPFVSAATGDFRLTAAAIAEMRGQAYPETWAGQTAMVALGGMGAWATSPPAVTVITVAGGGTYHEPSVGEVISTAVFGPASGISGTFVVPTAAQVEALVGFGADGTEFEGELVVGGGSGVPVVGGQVVRR